MSCYTKWLLFPINSPPLPLCSQPFPTHTHTQVQTHTQGTHRTLLLSFLCTVRRKGLCVIFSVLLMGLDGCVLGMLTCSWGTSNLCLWASVIWGQEASKQRVCVTSYVLVIYVLLCILLRFILLSSVKRSWQRCFVSVCLYMYEWQRERRAP